MAHREYTRNARRRKNRKTSRRLRKPRINQRGGFIPGDFIVYETGGASGGARSGIVYGVFQMQVGTTIYFINFETNAQSSGKAVHVRSITKAELDRLKSQSFEGRRFNNQLAQIRRTYSIQTPPSTTEDNDVTMAAPPAPKSWDNLAIPRTAAPVATPVAPPVATPVAAPVAAPVVAPVAAPSALALRKPFTPAVFASAAPAAPAAQAAPSGLALRNPFTPAVFAPVTGPPRDVFRELANTQRFAGLTEAQKEADPTYRHSTPLTKADIPNIMELIDTPLYDVLQQRIFQQHGTTCWYDSILTVILEADVLKQALRPILEEILRFVAQNYKNLTVSYHPTMIDDITRLLKTNLYRIDPSNKTFDDRKIKFFAVAFQRYLVKCYLLWKYLESEHAKRNLTNTNQQLSAIRVRPRRRSFNRARIDELITNVNPVCISFGRGIRGGTLEYSKGIVQQYLHVITGGNVNLAQIFPADPTVNPSAIQASHVVGYVLGAKDSRITTGAVGHEIAVLKIQGVWYLFDNEVGIIQMSDQTVFNEACLVSFILEQQPGGQAYTFANSAGQTYSQIFGTTGFTLSATTELFAFVQKFIPRDWIIADPGAAGGAAGGGPVIFPGLFLRQEGNTIWFVNFPINTIASMDSSLVRQMSAVELESMKTQYAATGGNYDTTLQTILQTHFTV